VQLLAFLSQLKLTAPVLIVMPTSLLFNWKNEIEKFLAHASVYLHHGPQRSGELSFLAKQALILTSYSTLRQDLALLSALHYHCVILDEAQMIKNAHTQVAQAVFALQADFRLSITGTPIENHLGELWSQFRFLIPDLFQSEKLFYAEVEASSSDRRYLEKIRKKIKPFFLRRTKEEVAKDLPERIDQIVLVEMSSEQREIYEGFLSGIRSNLIAKVSLDGLAKHRMEVLEALLRLRQICCHPLLVDQQLDQQTPNLSAKMELVLQDVAMAIEEKKKVLVYSQFTSLLQLLAKEFKERSWPFVYLDGNTVDREKRVESFQNDREIPLFLISLKAGGVGLNLTAADYVFLFDPWWNEAVENQAINRAHRIGRQETVIAKRYITVGTIEEKMMKMKEAKRSLAENIFQGDPNHPGISEEELLSLFVQSDP
jgi:SNF2 family DNA or RNA helicase